MPKPESEAVKKTLAATNVHEKWEGDYRGAENRPFYDMAFDWIARAFDAPEGATVLDAGCGIGDHSVRLAKRGFRVVGIDFSEVVVEEGREFVRQRGFEDRITLQPADLTSLPFDDATFEYVLCWGVLMHVPDVEAAMAELARVMKPGGRLAVSEGNLRSLEAFALRTAKRLLPGREKAELRRVPAGLERWADTHAGRLVTREADVRWMMRRFAELGLDVKKRHPGQFTEFYTRLHRRGLRRLVHAFNRFWFKCLPLPGPAFGNLLIFEKKSA